MKLKKQIRNRIIVDNDNAKLCGVNCPFLKQEEGECILFGIVLDKSYSFFSELPTRYLFRDIDCRTLKEEE